MSNFKKMMNIMFNSNNERILQYIISPQITINR